MKIPFLTYLEPKQNLQHKHCILFSIIQITHTHQSGYREKRVQTEL